jgi:hypothetical protein
VRFLKASLEMEYGFLHPLVKEALADLDVYSKEAGLPEVLVTHCLRSKAEQEEIYFKSLMKQLSLSESQARSRARLKPSWHLWNCAVDIRNQHYRPPQLTLVMARLKTNRAPNKWEILSHDVGRGSHCHIGYRDEEWRRKFEEK